MTHHTRRTHLEDLVARLGDTLGQTLTLDRYQPGDSRTPYLIEDERGQPLFGDRRRSAGELADCIRFALAALGRAEVERKPGGGWVAR